MKRWTRSIAKPFALFFLLGAIGVPVMYGCAGSETQRATGEYLDDKSISTRVKTKLLRDDTVSGMDVQVETYRGIVQLSGFVDNQEAKQQAEQLAKSVEGVEQVQNNISIKPEREQ